MRNKFFFSGHLTFGKHDYYCQCCIKLTKSHAHTRAWVWICLQRNRVMMVCSIALPQIPHLYHSVWNVWNKTVNDHTSLFFVVLSRLAKHGKWMWQWVFLPINSAWGYEGVLILKQNHCYALLGILQEQKVTLKSAFLPCSNAFIKDGQSVKKLTTLGAMPRPLLLFFFDLVEIFDSALLWAPLICLTCL